MVRLLLNPPRTRWSSGLSLLPFEGCLFSGPLYECFHLLNRQADQHYHREENPVFDSHNTLRRFLSVAPAEYAWTTSVLWLQPVRY